MMTRREAALALAATLLLPFPTAYAQAVRTPKPGSAERKALMDALRVPIEKKLKRPVIFKVDVLKVQGNWAFLRGAPLQKNGKPMDYRGTVYAEAIKEGAFDDSVCALFKRERGKWKLVTHALGNTDVAWDTWDEDYGAPPAIFK
ncbi:MAG TPA: hypothetical protein VM490_09910 [Armatimonadaceae bacterium]|nr:hypothetical protein [Armatimonadaceae bacterium]